MPFDASPQTDTVADVLRRARALIDSPEMWGKGDGGLDPKHGFCVITALMAVAHANASIMGAQSAFHRANEIDGYIGTWNDDDERTHAEVLDAFDKAISLAERGAR